MVCIRLESVPVGRGDVVSQLLCKNPTVRLNEYERASPANTHVNVNVTDLRDPLE